MMPRKQMLGCRHAVSMAACAVLVAWSGITHGQTTVMPFGERALAESAGADSERFQAVTAGIAVDRLIPKDPWDFRFQFGANADPQVSPDFLPFVGGERPQNADIRLFDKLYIDFLNWRTDLLYSSNINREESGGVSDWIAISRLRMSLTLSLSEKFNITTEGGFAWLPLEGRAGIEGFGVSDSNELNARYDASPLFLTEFSYTDRIYGWDIEVRDSIFSERKTISGLYGQNLQYGLFEGFDFEEEDRAGRYTFRGRTSNLDTELTAEERNFNETDDFGYGERIDNRFLIRGSHDTPLQSRFTVSYARRDTLRDDSPQSTATTSAERLAFRINSVRSNLRFKPFVEYALERTNDSDDWRENYLVGVGDNPRVSRSGNETSVATASGVRIPITDYTTISASYGKYEPKDGSSHRDLYSFSIINNPRPTLIHGFIWRRFVEETALRGDQLSTGWLYFLRKTINKRTTTEFSISNFKRESFNSSVDRETETIRWTVTHSPSTASNLLMRAQWTDDESLSGKQNDFNTFLFLLNYQRELNELWTANAAYIYQHRDSQVSGDSFAESVILLSAVRTFGAGQPPE